MNKSNPYNHPDYPENNKNDMTIIKIMIIFFFLIVFSPVIMFLLKTLFIFSVLLLAIILIVIISAITSKNVDSTYNYPREYNNNSSNNTKKYFNNNVRELEQRKNNVLEEYNSTYNDINSLISSPALFDKNTKEYNRFHRALMNTTYHSSDAQNVKELEHSWNDLLTKTRVNGLQGLTQSQRDIAYQLHSDLLRLDNDPVLYNHKLLELVNIVTMVNYDGHMLNIEPYELLKNFDD